METTGGRIDLSPAILSRVKLVRRTVAGYAFDSQWQSCPYYLTEAILMVRYSAGCSLEFRSL